MEKKDFYKRVLAGSFFLTTIVLTSVVVLTIGIEKGLTQPRFDMTVLYREVGGLGIGSRVSLSGVNVGTVASIDFLDQEIDGRGVKVGLHVFEKYRNQLEKGPRIAIKTAG